VFCRFQVRRSLAARACGFAGDSCTGEVHIELNIHGRRYALTRAKTRKLLALRTSASRFGAAATAAVTSRAVARSGAEIACRLVKANVVPMPTLSTYAAGPPFLTFGHHPSLPSRPHIKTANTL